jgi:hypothetical protein
LHPAAHNPFPHPRTEDQLLVNIFLGYYNLITLFANLNIQQKEKLNELIGAIHEKDELLDSQEEFLIKENKRHVKVKNACA